MFIIIFLCCCSLRCLLLLLICTVEFSMPGLYFFAVQPPISSPILSHLKRLFQTISVSWLFLASYSQIWCWTYSKNGLKHFMVERLWLRVALFVSRTIARDSQCIRIETSRFSWHDHKLTECIEKYISVTLLLCCVPHLLRCKLVIVDEFAVFVNEY